jgi:hypothetical protein
MLFNIPSNENKSNELLFNDIREFNFDIKFEKVISQFRADFPISWIEEDIKKLIFKS